MLSNNSVQSLPINYRNVFTKFFATAKKTFNKLALVSTVAVLSISSVGLLPFSQLAGALATYQLTGTVSDPNGQGIPNVEISATTPGGSTLEFGPVLTDSVGNYTLPIDPGTYDIHIIPAVGSGFTQVVESNYSVITDQVLDVQFTPATSTFSGTLTNSNGASLSGMKISLSASPWNGSNAVGSATTDSSGNFSIPAVSGTYYLTISGNSGNPSYELTQSTPGINLTNGDLVQDLQLKTAVVQVSVKNSDGSPAAGVFVLGNSGNVATTTLYPGDPGVNSSGALVSYGTTNSSGIFNMNTIIGATYEASPPAQDYRSICATIDGAQTCLSANLTVNGDSTVVLQKALPIPPTPINLTATSPTQTPVLNWGSSAGATSYNVYRDGVNVGSSSSATFTDTSATPGTYDYYVTAVNTAGESGQSNTIVVVVENSQPQTFTLVSSADSYLQGGQTNRNRGAETEINIQSSGNNRGLVRFDQSAINSTVGSGTVLSATLKLTIVDTGNNWGSTGRTLDIHRLLKDWAEGNGTSNDRGTGSGVTWDCAIDSDISNQSKNCSGFTEWEMGQPNNPSVHPWAETATASQNITSNQTGVVEYNVTSDIQAYLDGNFSNYGWLVRKTNEGQSGSIIFGSRESSVKPELVITYQP